jgi:putative ABC transport system permease protein
VLAIALGVAVVIAIDLAGDAAAGSFESSLVTLLGKVDYEITANGGVDENILARLVTLPANARFSPVIEAPILIPGLGSTTLYGVDAIGLANDSGVTGGAEMREGDLQTSAVVSSDLADRFHWHKGDAVTLRGPASTARVTVSQIVPNQTSGWIALDLSAAQPLTGSAGHIDRIEVFLAQNENAQAAERAIRAALPNSYVLETPAARSDENRRMLAAFRWNLRILSYISLVVGAFLIYNTIAVSVVRRRNEIGVLRAVGITARGALALFLGEALLLGFAGSALGVVLGRGLAGLILGMISDTVNSLFTTSAPAPIALTGTAVATAILAGAGVALFSALIPSLEAARVAPAEAMRREAREHDTRLHSQRDLALAALLALAAYGLSQLGPVDNRPLYGYLATLCAVAAAALVSPAFVLGAIAILRTPLRLVLSAPGIVAGRSLTAALQRTSILVTALATAISMMVSVGIMVGSFRETVEVWLAEQLRADIYMRAAGTISAGVYPPLDPHVAAITEKTPGVAETDIFTAFPLEYEGVRATFGAGIMDIVRRRRSLRFLQGEPDSILRSLPHANRAIVSEPFANKHHVRTGDILTLPLAGQEVSLTVAGVYYDYANDRGFVLVDRSTLLRLLPNQPPTNIAVYAAPNVDKLALRRELERRLAQFPVAIAPNEVLRRGAVEVFDRTFLVTYALEAVAVLVAMLGAANSLLALVLDRRREIGLIRYLGAAREQVRTIVLTEAGLIGLLAAALGLVLGTALSLVLIYVINKQSFGWTIQFHPPLALLGAALALVWCFTVVAGLYPAHYATKLEPADAVHTE